jgi:chorismate-pyruvate lyase
MRSSQTADLQRALRESSDTVTQILEARTGEPIVADVARQYPIAAEADNGLDVSKGHLLLHRIAVLRGRTSARPYVYAESTFVPDRLPEGVQQQLAGTTEPIGRILLAHGFALDRKPIPWSEDLDPAPAPTLRHASDEVIWARAYLLQLDEVPVFAIREWFFSSVLDPPDRPVPA